MSENIHESGKIISFSPNRDNVSPSRRARLKSLGALSFEENHTPGRLVRHQPVINEKKFPCPECSNMNAELVKYKEELQHTKSLLATSEAKLVQLSEKLKTAQKVADMSYVSEDGQSSDVN